jgi:hypothetical protein
MIHKIRKKIEMATSLAIFGKTSISLEKAFFALTINPQSRKNQMSNLNILLIILKRG